MDEPRLPLVIASVTNLANLPKTSRSTIRCIVSAFLEYLITWKRSHRRLVLSLFARRPYVIVKPREEQDVSAAKLASKLIQAQFDKQAMLVKAFLWIKQALIYGSSPAQIGWRKVELVAGEGVGIVAGSNC